MLTVVGKIMGPYTLMSIDKESKGRKKTKACQHDFVEKDLFKQNYFYSLILQFWLIKVGKNIMD